MSSKKDKGTAVDANTAKANAKGTSKGTDTKKVRTAIMAAVFGVLCIGLIAGINLGTLSGFGWDTFSALCPMGAFTTMIATKTMVPRAVVSIAVMAVLVLLVGRAFCGWVCPVPMIQRIGRFFKKGSKRRAEDEARETQMRDIAKYDLSCGHDCASCASCKQKHGKLDSRHAVLGGALVSTAIFGFPVFCLVCPIGLSFATVLIVWRLFSAGDMTLSVLLVPAILIIELVFLRKWCARICPIAGLMNLASRFSRTWRPQIDDTKCIETTTGHACSRCAIACQAEINLRHPDFGERTLDDCTRCRACLEACPTNAISMPFSAQGSRDAKGRRLVTIDEPLSGAGKQDA